MWIFQQIGSILCKREREKEKEQYCNMDAHAHRIESEGFWSGNQEIIIDASKYETQKNESIVS